MSALDPIIAYKADEVAALKRTQSESELLQTAHSQPAPRPFLSAMSAVCATGDNALICEMKRKSPSAGEILPGANPVDIAKDYEAGGAACLSVLTDGPSFGGSVADFQAIRAAVSLPMLRKDFMIDPLQVIEARAMGADAVLVILSCSDDALASDLIATADDLGMTSLIETHTKREVERALKLDGGIIGINNRDLTRMVTDLATTEALMSAIPTETEIISQSGITKPKDISRLRKVGLRRIVIGE
ncbi:MAG: indole-3-glycerol phosphate synthase TrpC, partial [Pseudomonadota bacterium]